MRLPFCALCGCNDSARLEHHHVIPRSLGGSDDDTNLLTVCHECHGKLHGMRHRGDISTLTREGLQRAQARGQRLGMRSKSKAQARAIQIAGAQAHAQVALKWAKANRWAIEGAVKEAGSMLGAAKLLNQRGIPSATGGAWYASSVTNVARRLALLRLPPHATPQVTLRGT